MGWRYVGNKNYKKGGGFNWTGSQRGLNTSYTFDFGFFKLSRGLKENVQSLKLLRPEEYFRNSVRAFPT